MNFFRCSKSGTLVAGSGKLEMIIIRLKTGYGGGGGQRTRAIRAPPIGTIAGHVRKMGDIATAHIGGATGIAKPPLSRKVAG